MTETIPVDSLPGQRCRRACQLLRMMRTVPWPKVGLIGEHAPRWAHQAVADLLKCGLICCISDKDMTEHWVWRRQDGPDPLRLLGIVQ